MDLGRRRLRIDPGNLSSPTKSAAGDDARRVLARLHSSSRRLNRPEQLAKKTGLDLQAVERALDELVTRGEVVRARQGRVGLAERLGLVTGIVRVGRRGRAVVVPDEPDAPIALPRGSVRPAMHGDRVLVAAEPYTRRGLQRGSIREVLERAHTSIIGVVHGERGRDRLLIPSDMRLGEPATIEGDDAVEAGQVVRAEIVAYPTSYRSAAVRVSEVLGPAGTLTTEIESIRMAMGIDDVFSRDAQHEADAFPSPSVEDVSEREDLRDLFLLTVDPDDARDFDDAVWVERNGDGFRVIVSIADVSHYVRPGSALDREAADRATSVYFPGRCVPMLPERLSGELASLKPQEDRLAVSVFLEVDAEGAIVSQRFARTIIRSRRRLSYDQAEHLIDDRGDAEESVRVRTMWSCAAALLARRAARGAIDLDIPEAVTVLDQQGEPLTVLRRPRLRSHRMIEELMLAANEAVARQLESLDLPFLYRIHEKPDPEDVEMLARRLSLLAIRLPHEGARLQPADLQAAVAQAADRPHARLVHLMVLRAMTRARYDPYKAIHFGLASSCYTHFTSPIRRYPDIVAHRALCRAMEPSGDRLPTRNELEPTARHCSERERRAMDAERDAARAAAIMCMQAHMNATFAGMVTGVERFGFYVELAEPFVEGFVPLSRLYEYYEYVAERMELCSRTSTSRIRVGDPIDVRVVACDLAERRLELAPVEAR